MRPQGLTDTLYLIEFDEADISHWILLSSIPIWEPSMTFVRQSMKYIDVGCIS